MGGVQSGTHNFGDALWMQERQKQKCHRDGSRYDSNGHGPQQAQQNSGSNSSTQDSRKLLKRTRSLAVISEDESRAASSGGDTCTLRLGSSCGSTPSPFDSAAAAASLQRRRHQLIPRAKLIDRNSLKDRLSKSQQHLHESYERYAEPGQHERVCQSRSVCGLYSLPPPLEPLPYAARASCYTRQQQQQQTSYVVEDCLGPDRLNILKWPEESPRRYRSVQDLNSVSGLVDIVEDNYWPGEENRSVDCIYTQVKRKRKEHRSLDSILFEDDSDELEYFDILNLLPLSNVRLEVGESDVPNNNAIPDTDGKEPPNRELKSNPTVISVSTKPKPVSSSEKCCKHRTSGVRITEIDEIVPADIEEKKSKNHPTAIFEPPASSDRSVADKGITSFPELAREKRQFESTCYAYDGKFDLLKRRENQRRKTVESCQSKTKKAAKKEEADQTKKEIQNLHSAEEKKPKVEETEDTKSIWISDNEETDEMSRRPQVLKIIDNDITKSKSSAPKTINIEVKPKDNDVAHKENVYENATTNYQTYQASNKPDLINDHIHEPKSDMEAEKEKDRLSVENARSFFEKKSSDQEPLANRHSEGRFERIVKETSNILGKACSAVKGSLGFEARSESSDLGLGSEIGSDVRRLSVDENTNVIDERANDQKQSNECNRQYDDVNDKNHKNYTNLTRSRSCIDSIECQDSDEPEFDHVRYKIVKSNMFSKNIFNNSKKDVTYDGLMQYLREYSFQDLLMDNNVVIIEPVRAEVERKPSFNDSKLKSSPSFKVSSNALEKIKASDLRSADQKSEKTGENHFAKTPRQSSLRKHFFYQPIRVNRELNDDELPDPDTVRNVRKMFEETMKGKLTGNPELTRDCSARKSVSMKDLRTIEIRTFDCESEKSAEAPRSRCSSRAKDLTKMFENMEKASSPSSITAESKDDVDSPRVESKTRTLAQSFEARSGQTSPSNSNSSKLRVNNRYHQRQLHNWDAGSVSSGVSSDYPDTDAGSAPHCTSSEDEELYCQDDDGVDERYEGHYVSPDVLKKIREHGTSVTYYGGKVVNTCNGPLICPMVCKKSKGSKKSLDYVKFRLVKSNSCDSRLELTGRVIENRNKYESAAADKCMDLRQFTIDETPSIEITSMEQTDGKHVDDKAEAKEEKREPPVVIGLEPKKEENKSFKADFKLGKLEDCAASSINRFAPSALTRWQINENTWKRTSDFGKMEFEEFEVLEDSLNGADN
ncbi:uncharacterized protein LOC100679372 isoform X1 [Nasonia vitripennis]|uniref:Uncharacterized protein n=1 Tax=Nasonia vitripennis TaxID=7425 RepID=A0A7M7Q1Z3_NASVI|nr:uncharacterized protein LOC100679372 isoform X1 [Nasonia vitripennis]XP_031780570.1 uncharacterized protein LOC100679372 isoform X1 [Nasonia vitripennis]